LDESLYHAHYREETTHFWFVARARIVRHMLEREAGLAPGDTVLDIGCGAGGFLAQLADLYRVVGIDTSPLAIEYAKSRGLADVFVMPLSDFPREKWDVRAALLLDVIEHVDDDVGLLRRAKEIVRPGGAIIVTVPAYMWLWSAHDVLNHHKRRYTARTLRASIEAAGLRATRLTYFNTFLFPLAVARRIADREKNGEAACAAVGAPPKLVNAALTEVFAAERHLLPRVSLPFGVSLLAIARG
jgi:SAM-dependent methyltransferase